MSGYIIKWKLIVFSFVRNRDIYGEYYIAR